MAKRKAADGVRMLSESLEMVPVGSLLHHPRNPNQGDVGAIHESIAHNGFWGTIVAQRATGHVLAGNHRLLAAKHAGATEVPVTWVDVDDEHALRILLADNRTTRLGNDEPGQVVELLQEVLRSQGSLEGTGYDGDALDELLADLGLEAKASGDPGSQSDRTDELREKWGTERGQVWAIPSGALPTKSHRPAGRRPPPGSLPHRPTLLLRRVPRRGQGRGVGRNRRTPQANRQRPAEYPGLSGPAQAGVHQFGRSLHLRIHGLAHVGVAVRRSRVLRVRRPVHDRVGQGYARHG